jgi:hypothetical protein
MRFFNKIIKNMTDSKKENNSKSWLFQERQYITEEKYSEYKNDISISRVMFGVSTSYIIDKFLTKL